MMSRFSLRGLFGRLFGTEDRPTKRQRSHPRLSLEALEDRWVPSGLQTIQTAVANELQTVQAAFTAEVQAIQSATAFGKPVVLSASSDASAKWLQGKDSPVGSPVIALTVGSSLDTYAAIQLTHVAGPLPSIAPSFTTSNYNAGSPRWYITLDNGDYLFGYPSQGGSLWEVNGSATYITYDQVLAQEGNAQVTGVYVLADGDQAPGTTDVITSLQYNGHNYIPQS